MLTFTTPKALGILYVNLFFNITFYLFLNECHSPRILTYYLQCSILLLIHSATLYLLVLQYSTVCRPSVVFCHCSWRSASSNLFLLRPPAELLVIKVMQLYSSIEITYT